MSKPNRSRGMNFSMQYYSPTAAHPSMESMSPFEVLYGRPPTVPIDNILERENNVKPARDLQEFLKERFDNQLNMCNILHNERQKRFDRNKRAEGQLDRK